MLSTSDSLLIAFEYYEFATQAFPHCNVHFCVLMNCVVVDNLTVESPVVIVICNSERDGTGYNTYGNQYPEVGYCILKGDT